MTTDRTLAFVDPAGFTALTDAHGDQAAIDLVDAFAAPAADPDRHLAAQREGS